jgi:AraC family transcriptional regulator
MRARGSNKVTELRGSSPFVSDTLEVRQDNAVERHLFPSIELSSSATLGWKGIVVRRYRTEPGEKAEVATACHFLAEASGRQMCFGERRGARGRLVPYSKQPGTLHLYSEGLIPAIYPSAQTELTVCELDTAFVAEIAKELESSPTPELRQHVAFLDGSLSSLVGLLEAAAKSGTLSEPLYVEHLTYALTLRLLSLDMNREPERIAGNALSGPRLRRVLDRMEADLSSELNLKTLANESGYSRNHFLKMFREATHCSPHRYLVELRVKRAQSMMMQNKSMRLIDIAHASGFSSDAHLSKAFRQVTGATPSEYRRNIR